MELIFTLTFLFTTTAFGQVGPLQNRAIPDMLKRQAVNPGEVSRKTCASFGPDYVECGTRYCYNPATEICCGADAEGWACDNTHFCFVTDYCCPNGLDPQTCANNNGIVLSSSFISGAPTKAGDNGGSSSPTTSVGGGSGGGAPTPSSTSSSDDGILGLGGILDSQGVVARGKFGIAGAVVGLTLVFLGGARIVM